MTLSPAGYCQICKDNNAEVVFDGRVQTFDCPRCGHYKISTEDGWLIKDDPDHIVRLSGWVREQNDSGVQYPSITQAISRRVTQMRLPKIRTRSISVLKVIARNWPDLTVWYDFKDFAQIPGNCSPWCAGHLAA